VQARSEATPLARPVQLIVGRHSYSVAFTSLNAMRLDAEGQPMFQIICPFCASFVCFLRRTATI